MTGTIEDPVHAPDGPPSPRAEHVTSALLEQAKGVLIFRYAVDECVAAALIERWAAELGITVDDVASVLVHQVSQGRPSAGSEPRIVRAIEDRLRRDEPTSPDPASHARAPVRVSVNEKDSSLDAVVTAAREAAIRGVPLEVTVHDEARFPQEADPHSAHVRKRAELAAELAQAVEPSIEVLLPPHDGG